METLYRKVNISERLPEKASFYFTIATSGVQASQWFMNGKFSYESPSYTPTWWLEEITDPTAQLKADKAELLSALEKISKVTDEGYMTIDTNFEVWESELKQVHGEIESLIQKHKQ